MSHPKSLASSIPILAQLVMQEKLLGLIIRPLTVGVNKPIYRYLANKKWREMERPILMQRLEQMKVIPDLLPYIDPVVDVQVRFRGRDVRPGTILDTRRTETQPTIKIVPFEVGEMLCTVAVVDPDVPDPEKDRYKYRLHWLVFVFPCFSQFMRK